LGHNGFVFISQQFISKLFIICNNWNSNIVFNRKFNKNFYMKTKNKNLNNFDVVFVEGKKKISPFSASRKERATSRVSPQQFVRVGLREEENQRVLSQ